MNKTLGITVLPEYVQSETVDGVLDRLQAAGVNAITTSPYVMRLADPPDGGRKGVSIFNNTLTGVYSCQS